MSKKKDLKGLFKSLQNQMVSTLNTNRESIDHSGSKGDALEDVWIKWLRKYLPNRYCVDKAKVIDHEGSLSDQIDLVIYDQQYTPFVFSQNGIHYIPAEGVYAVFEIKPDLKGSVRVKGESISYIEYAGRKIESVRILKRTSAKIVDRGMLKDARPLTKIIGGILSNVNTYKNTKTVEKHMEKLTGLKTLDMGCAAESHSFYLDYNGKEDAEIIDMNKRIRKYYASRSLNGINFSNLEQSLVTFFLQLSRYLQQGIGTVAAIDLSVYAKQLDFKLDEEI